MPSSPNFRPVSPLPPGQGQLIVARDEAGLRQALQDVFIAKGRFTVIVDRRRVDPRQGGQSVTEDRQRPERRRLPSLKEELLSRPYVVVPGSTTGGNGLPSAAA